MGTSFKMGWEEDDAVGGVHEKDKKRGQLMEEVFSIWGLRYGDKIYK